MKEIIPPPSSSEPSPSKGLEAFTKPTFEQQVAFEALNRSIIMLAKAYGVDKDQLSEVVGPGVETAIEALLEDKAA